MWEDLLSGRPPDLIEATCFPAIIYQNLSVDGHVNQRIVPWCCAAVEATDGDETAPMCSECGVYKILKISECNAFLTSFEPDDDQDDQNQLEVLDWKLMPRQGTNERGVPNTQLELAPSWLTLAHLIQRFTKQLKICRTHFIETKWINRMRLIDVQAPQPHELLVCTDFSATLDLMAKQKMNSSVDSHAVLAIYVILHSPEKVTVKLANDTTQEVNYNECDVWYFFGSSMSAGKKTDRAVLHNECLSHIIQHYNQEGPKFKCLKCWTDNCSGENANAGKTS
jgi:hypothetical protein